MLATYSLHMPSAVDLLVDLEESAKVPRAPASFIELGADYLEVRSIRPRLGLWSTRQYLAYSSVIIPGTQNG